MRRMTDESFIVAMSLAVAVALAGCDARTDAPPSGTAADGMEESTPAPRVPASGTAAPGGVDRQFAMMDGNGDGRVTAEEHASGAAAMFATMDADGDARVTVAEMDAAQSKLGGDVRMASADKIRVVDGNADGLLSRDEHVEGARAMFGRMDADGDGALTRDELAAGHDVAMGGGGG